VEVIGACDVVSCHPQFLQANVRNGVRGGESLTVLQRCGFFPVSLEHVLFRGGLWWGADKSAIIYPSLIQQRPSHHSLIVPARSTGGRKKFVDSWVEGRSEVCV